MWKNYFGNLYADTDAIVDELDEYEEELDILLDELKAAIKMWEKVNQLDQIQAEVLKALDDRVLKTTIPSARRFERRDSGQNIGPRPSCNHFTLVK